MKRALPVLALVLLAGCSPSSLLAPSGAPAKLYTLSAPAAVATTGPQVGWQLLIAVPEAEMDLDVPRIAVAPSPGRIDYYADVAWADRPPAMMQELLLQAFERSGRIAAVERRGSGNLKADFLLTSDMQDFEVDAATGAPVAHLRITVRLVRTRDRTIVASRTFEATPSASGGLDGALAGFNAGLADMLPQIVDWTLTQGNANP